MTKRFLIVAFLFACGVSTAQIPAGFVNTTATVSALSGGTYSASWVNLSSSSQLPLLGGMSTFPITAGGKFDSSGHMSVLLADTSQIIPSPSTWSFTLTYACGSGFTVNVAVTGGGGTQDISSQITAALPTNPCASTNTGNSASSFTATGALPVSIPTGLFGYGSLGYNDSNTVAAYSASVNSYFQAIIQNTSSGTGASADYVVSNNLGTATTYYGDFGMNSSGFSGTGSGSLPNAVYMTANNGDLVLGTNTSNLIRFYVNGGATDSLRITSAGVIQIPGIAAVSGYNCVQIDSSGNITNTGSACGASGSGTVNSGTTYQLAYYAANGTAVSGDSLLTDNSTTLAYTGTQGIQAYWFGSTQTSYSDYWEATYRGTGCPTPGAHQVELCAKTDPGPGGVTIDSNALPPSPPSTGNNELVSLAGAAPSWVAKTSVDVQSCTAYNLTTTSATNVCSLTIPAYRVVYKGIYEVSAYCGVAVASGQTASTFTMQLKFYNNANTTSYNITPATASPSVAAATPASIEATGYDLIANYSTSTGMNLVGGQVLYSVPSSSASFLGAGIATSSTFYGSPTLIDTVGSNRIDVWMTTNNANATANTATCNIIGKAVNP